MKENYLIMPYSILELPELNSSQKIILAEIISLTRIKGNCFASNKFLAEKCQITERTISTSISKLLYEKYITVKTKRNNTRIIRLNTEKLKEKSISLPLFNENSSTPEKISNPIEKTSNPIEKVSTPIERISTYNNNYNNKYKNNYNYKSNKNSNIFSINSKNTCPYESSYDIEELMKIR